jgi:hypothetical protein
VYKILLKHTTAVQPISCDEAYLDVTGLSDPFQIAAAIRAEVMLGQQLLLSKCLAVVCHHRDAQLSLVMVAGAGGDGDRVHRQRRHWPQHAPRAAGHKACQAEWRLPLPSQ